MNTASYLTIFCLVTLCGSIVYSATIVVIDQMINTTTTTTTESSVKATARCNRTHFDECALKMAAFGDAAMHWPVNLKEMNARCKENLVLEKCTRDYTRNCLTADSRNSITVILFGVAKTNKGYCSSRKRKNAYISFGRCANAVNANWTAVVAGANREFHGAATHEDVKLRIPLACCIYHKYKQKVVDVMVEKARDENCTEAAIAEADKAMESYGRDGLNLLCGDYQDDSDKCEQIINKVPSYTKSLNSKAFILGLADLFESI